jgi:plasmid stabilization system protein ParE
MGCAFEGNMRRYVYKDHLVYYEIKKEEIHILRIRHGQMKP